MNLITCDKVTMSFRRHVGKRLIRDHVAHWFSRGRETERFYALKNISFSVSEGRSIGILGHNGAGKSTLLSILAGVARPDSGTVSVTGRVAALLELGSGFHPDLTGIENVRMNAALVGFSRARTHDTLESIIDFSGVGDFINEPLRTYSSGMVLRLAFAVAIHIEPDILIVDEILAVGDQDFQAKCYDRIRKMRAKGVTLICVSHSPSLLLEFCDRGFWLDHGELVMKGRIEEIVSAYTGTAPMRQE